MNDILKVSTEEFKIEFVKPNVNSEFALVFSVWNPGINIPDSIKPGVQISSIGGTPVVGLGLEDIKVLITKFACTGELCLKLADTGTDVCLLFSPQSTHDSSLVTIVKDKATDNLRLIHRQAYCSMNHPTSCNDSHLVPSSNPTPQINFKPKHSVSSISNPSSVQHLGAVASLALDGGLTAAQIRQIGSSSGSQSGYYSTTNCNYNVTQIKDQKVIPRHLISADRKYLTSRIVHYPQPHQHCHPSATDMGHANIFSLPHTRHTARVLQWPVSRGIHAASHSCGNSRRGSFPVQMTRVGGLVVTPVISTATTVNSDVNSHSPQKTTPSVYQSVSVCSSPASLKPTDSTSNTFFPFTDTGPETSVRMVPMCKLSDSLLGTDIVRLGPGDTVTREPANAKICNRTNLIRMHCYPQPYVSKGQGSERSYSSVSPVLISDSIPSNYQDDIDIGPASGSRSDLGVKITNDCVAHNKISVSSPVENSTIIITNHSNNQRDSKQYSPTSVTSDSASGHSRLKTQSVVTNSVNSAQIVRTVRHLRRIRHIFGDPINYTKSATSASMGALTIDDRDGTTDYKLGELHPHGCRSVESVGPAVSCDCPKFTNIDSQEKGKPPHLNGPIKMLYRCDHGLDENLHTTNMCWKDYYFKLTNGNLILNLDCSSEQIVDPADNPVHLHIPLADSTWQWWQYSTTTTTSTDLFDICSKLPKSEQLTESDNCSHNNTKLIGVLTNLKFDVIYYIYFPDRQLAADFIDYFGEPNLPTFDTKTEKPHTTQNSSLNFLNFRSKRSLGGSGSGCVNLGLAGPVGVLPLYKAADTAAASIGMPLRDYTHLHDSSFSINSVVRPSSSPANGEVNKSKAENMDSSTSSKPKESKFSHTLNRGRGRLHQALNRIRRAATASHDPISRSTTNVETRRFASSHSSCGKAASDFNSPPSSSNFTESDDLLLYDVDNVSASQVSTTLCTNYTNPPSALLAASVSPSPSLQTSCLTYAQLETNLETTEDMANSEQDQLIQKQNELSQNQLSISKTKSDHRYHSLASITTTTTLSDRSQSSLEQNLVLRNTINTTTTRTTTKEVVCSSESHAMTTHSQPLFIPLPSSYSSEPLPLHKCPRSTLSPFVPFVVELCVTLVERYGLNCVGLYRLSGSKVAHDFITSELNKNISTIDVTSDKWNDLHAVCGVLKTFLRNLPDSLFPKVMYSDFLAACRLPQRERRLLSIQRLLSIMECYPSHPEYRAHRATLRYLATHLARVSAREAVNRMTAYNLALVFAPNLVQPYEDSPELLISDSKYKIMLVELVIKYHAWIFSPDLGLESGCSVPPDSTENLTSELDVGEQSVTATETDDSTPQQPGRIEGDVKPLVSELLQAAANLPPPPSDTDLETAEIPGPESDRPSDIAVSKSKLTSASVTVALYNQIGERMTGSTVSMTQSKLSSTTTTTVVNESETVIDKRNIHSDSTAPCSPLIRSIPNFGSKLDNLRHLSQGCLEQYTSEAHKLGARVAENRRHLQTTVAQRLHAQQLLSEARGENLDCDPLPAFSTTSHSSSCIVATSATASISNSSSSSSRKTVVRTTELKGHMTDNVIDHGRVQQEKKSTEAGEITVVKKSTIASTPKDGRT